MSFKLVRLLYNALFPLAFLVLLPGYLARMWRRGNFKAHFFERFGRYAPDLERRLGEGGRTWIHAVSVGEVLIGLKLAREMRRIDPGFKGVLSTTTTTGYALATKERLDWLEVIYHPLDLPWIVKRAARLIRPGRLVLIEAEVWPNLVWEARRIGARVVLANARLSPRSERRFRAVRRIVSPLFDQLDRVCLQESADQPRFHSIGINPEKIMVTGSIKFDQQGAPPKGTRTGEFRAILDRIGVGRDAPVLLGGSTFAGEEMALARIFSSLGSEFPGLSLLLVPRHVERANEVVAELARSGVRVVRRTAPAVEDPCRVLLVDTTGELRDWYALADVVFIGKSLFAKGGQNPVEPILVGKPVLFGPHMENFQPLASELAGGGGGVEVKSESELLAAVSRLLRNPGERARIAETGLRIVGRHNGATERTARLILGTDP